MADFFSENGKFIQGLTRIMDCMLLSLLWVVCCLPVFTIGAATTALFQEGRRALREHKSYVVRGYFESFRSNFKQITPIFLLQLGLFALFWADAYMAGQFLLQGNSLGLAVYLFYVLMILDVCWCFYTCAYTARFDLDRRGIMKNSALIAFMNLPWSALMMVILFVVGWFVLYWAPPLILIMPGLLTWLFLAILERIFRKYMSPEELSKLKEKEEQEEEEEES